MHLLWWQWILAVLGGLVGLVALLVLLLVVAVCAAFVYEDRRRAEMAKQIYRYAKVAEKLPPSYVFGSGAFGESLDTPWYQPWRSGTFEPAYYQLVLGISYDDSEDEDYPQLREVRFRVVVDKETYELARVGENIENPLYDPEFVFAPA